jgi:hypothetical protein
VCVEGGGALAFLHRQAPVTASEALMYGLDLTDCSLTCRMPHVLPCTSPMDSPCMQLFQGLASARDCISVTNTASSWKGDTQSSGMRAHPPRCNTLLLLHCPDRNVWIHMNSARVYAAVLLSEPAACALEKGYHYRFAGVTFPALEQQLKQQLVEQGCCGARAHTQVPSAPGSRRSSTNMASSLCRHINST